MRLQRLGKIAKQDKYGHARENDREKKGKVRQSRDFVPSHSPSHPVPQRSRLQWPERPPTHVCRKYRAPCLMRPSGCPDLVVGGSSFLLYACNSLSLSKELRNEMGGHGGERCVSLGSGIVVSYYGLLFRNLHHRQQLVSPVPDPPLSPCACVRACVFPLKSAAAV
ncbi:hypothetical protein GGR56DRAFT_524482 [Xylariaceae sp. FL0804]|nr:hypothetical protein GGR56DRAFT_524482 [Xylariaceae sp. FL0804]